MKAIIMSAPMVREVLLGTQRIAKLSGACPYSGDRFWVKETWRYCCAMVSPKVEATIEYVADGAKRNIKLDSRAELPKENKIPDDVTAYKRELLNKKYWAKHRSSIFMPRWASRITIEVVQLQEIREAEDALFWMVKFNVDIAKS